MTSTRGKNSFSSSTLSWTFWFDLLNGYLCSKTGKMQKNLVGNESDAGSIIVSGKETLMSLDREPKYAQGIV